MKFKPLQELVASHYCDGEFSEITCVSDTTRCGDALFRFCILEAGDASTSYELWQMLETAVKQLQDLQRELT